MSKFGPFERMGTRETQRREWREAVARAAEALVTCRRILATKTTFSDRFYYGCNVEDAEYLLACELREPKPWTRPAKADLGKWRIDLSGRRYAIHPRGKPMEYLGPTDKAKSVREALRRKRRAAQRRRR